MRRSLLPRVPYNPPAWAESLVAPKYGRVPFAALPTPLMRWACPELEELGVEWWIKRDDCSGVELSGNKARKLEFLMAEAVERGHDCVVTIGGLQSNHCRATAAAARLVGLEPHIVLLVRDREIDHEVGMEGNLLMDRMMGAKLHLAAASDYLRLGGDLAAMDKLNTVAAESLKADGRNPYVVPVGGTGGDFAEDGLPIGSWGYIAAAAELCEQTQAAASSSTAAGAPPASFDHVVIAAGSGGSASGLAIGLHLAPISTTLHAVNVQHTPDVYYKLVEEEARALGMPPTAMPPTGARGLLQIHNGGTRGYGNASPEELEMIRRIGAASGVVLDHVYTGRALFHFCEHARASPETFRGKRILFWHTGGLAGLYAQAGRLTAMVDAPKRLRVDPNGDTPIWRPGPAAVSTDASQPKSEPRKVADVSDTKGFA